MLNKYKKHTTLKEKEFKNAIDKGIKYAFEVEKPKERLKKARVFNQENPLPNVD